MGKVSVFFCCFLYCCFTVDIPKTRDNRILHSDDIKTGRSELVDGLHGVRLGADCADLRSLPVSPISLVA